MSTTLHVAGRVVGAPFEVMKRYVGDYGRTVREYDGGGPGAADVLTLDEVVRTRIIKSRINKKEAEWFVETAADAPWSSVPQDAHLRDADPTIEGGLYDAADELYRWFYGRRRLVSTAKVSKVLHIKRPHLFPILDQRLCRLYRPAARTAATQHPGRNARRMFWEAVRMDLLNEENQRCLADLRPTLAGEPATAPLASLSDVRLLDIVTWDLG